MALITTVSVNDKPLYWIDAVRIQGGDAPDDLNLYQVRVHAGEDHLKRMATFHLKHRYGDGALALSRKVLDMTADLEGAKII